MKILAVGGGSGGHVTPVVAVLKELRARHPKVELQFWCDTKFASQAASIMGGFDETIPVRTIAAGKFRRYHHLSALQHLVWPSLMWANLTDTFKVAGGLVQSIWKLVWWRPDVIFTKGGYVCLPVGMAARILHIPLVIHDSDAHPGLTNRVLSKWATSIGTGAPLEYYNYPASRSRYVGIPINEAFRPYSKAEQAAAKKEWGISPDKPLLVVTGGGLGARRLNNVVVESLKKLQQYVSVVLVAGAGQYDELRAILPPDGPHFQLYPFINTIHSLLGASDIVATRAGATTILELAALQKPTILVPNAALTGGHQLKNAAVYEEAQVAIVVNEDAMVEKPEILVRAVKSYLDDPRTTATMAKRFGKFARPNAAKDMADLIIKAARTHK
jgi:UDP-N-acetylglucosamine--N-acetylmuramyl-(pentapeptide) pyrophosphoryl-undecaprenol N-acetylglucosamine transferase